MAEANTTVEYREIQGFPGYRVGDDGSVWSRWAKLQRKGRGTITVLGDDWKPLKQHRQGGRSAVRSYLQVRLKWNGKSRLCRVHRLVLDAFMGPCPAGHECRHLDGNPVNNRLDNLCWGTPLENAADRKDHAHHSHRNRLYTHDGKTMVLKDWARESGVPYLTLWNRLKIGVPFAAAIAIRRYDRKAIKEQKGRHPEGRPPHPV